MLENERKHTSVFCLSGVGYRKAFNLATFQCFTTRLWTPSRVLSKNDLDFKYSPRCNWLEPTRANKFQRKVQSTKLKRDKKASIIGIIGADLFFAVYSYITHTDLARHDEVLALGSHGTLVAIFIPAFVGHSFDFPHAVKEHCSGKRVVNTATLHHCNRDVVISCQIEWPASGTKCVCSKGDEE